LQGIQSQIQKLRVVGQSPAHHQPIVCLGRVRISLQVWHLTLPITPTLPFAVGLSDEIFEKRLGLSRGSPAWQLCLDQYAKFLLSYRMSPYFCRWGHGEEYMQLLTYTSPWPMGDLRCDELLSDPRMAAFAVPFAPQEVAPEAPGPSKNGDHEPFANQRDSNSSLKNAVDWLQARPLVDFAKAYFYLWDEPKNTNQYRQLKNLADVVHQAAPQARVLTTYYCGLEDGANTKGSFQALLAVPSQLRGTTQIFSTSEWALGGRPNAPEAVKNQLKGSEEWWGYVCMGPGDPEPNLHMSMSGSQHRAVLWRAWAQGCDGYLYWGANCYDTSHHDASAKIEFREDLPLGDGVLLYPGQAFGVGDQPIGSVRLERALSGMQDFEYLEAFAKIFGRRRTLELLADYNVYARPQVYA